MYIKHALARFCYILNSHYPLLKLKKSFNFSFLVFFSATFLHYHFVFIIVNGFARSGLSAVTGTCTCSCILSVLRLESDTFNLQGPLSGHASFLFPFDTTSTSTD